MTQISVESKLTIQVEDIRPAKRWRKHSKAQVKLVATYESYPIPGSVWAQPGDTIVYDLKIRS